MALKLSSSAFENEGTIPEKHSKLGGNISPTLSWSGVPKKTIHLALIMDGPDAPGRVFVHWLVYGLSPKTKKLEEGQPPVRNLPNGAHQGVNDFLEVGYGGPQPPSGTHRYFFHLYALDTDMYIPIDLTRQELDGAIEGHILEEAQLMGRYQSKEKSRGA
jgi:Raf kinase inhibitor-like YbhB/YbcL family protein